MASVEERVAYLEGRMEDHADAVGQLRGAVKDLREGMDRRFESVDRRFDAVDGRLAALDQKFDRHFTWIVGIQVAILVTIVGTLAGSYYR